ncbi:MAG: ABC transporter permease [bacterium]
MGKSIYSLREGLNIALRALVTNKTRSLLTTLGIVIGVVTVTLMLMIIQGLNRSFQNQIAVLGTNTVYIDKFPWIITDNSFYRYINRPNLTMENFEYVQRFSDRAEYLSAATGTRRAVGYRNTTLERILVAGVTPNAIRVNGFSVETGRFITESDLRTNRKVCVIGKSIQEELFGPINPLGRKVRVGSDVYRVVGTLERMGEMFGNSLDDRLVMPITTFQQVLGHRRSLEISAKAYDGEDLDALVDELTYLMRRSRHLKPLEEDNFSINRMEMLESFYKQITAGVYAAGLVIGGIALLVGGVGIMNIMLVSVAERTWEIGMRKAVGAKTADILLQFLVEAMLICMLGGAIGLLLAAGAGQALKSQLPVSLPLWLSVMAVLFSGFIGIVFGLFPAAKAARMDPIVALRQE